MRIPNFFRTSSVVLALLPLPAGAVSLVIDYDYDTSGFFPVGGTARATLEKAASDLSSVLSNVPLAAMTTNSFTGNDGASHADVVWSLSFTNPSDGITVTLADPQLTLFHASEIRIFAGWRNLTGTTLGQGGPASMGVSLGASSTGAASLQAAVNDMISQSDAVMARGGGPVIGSLSGGLGSAAFDLDYGSFAGNLWFDSDTDNNGTKDTVPELEAAWNLGPGGPGSTQIDFYSVALHELMHAIGFGTSASWTALGSDPNIDAGHLAGSTMSPRLSDAVMQSAVMTPSIGAGVRRELTAIDLEYLNKIGFVPVPEPVTSGLIVLTGSLMIFSGRRRPDRLVA